MSNSTKSIPQSFTVRFRAALWIFLVGSLLFAAACGEEGQMNASAGKYPAGSKTEADVERELKFDARVKDYETQGDKLIVNVNQSFASSPPGIQERAMGNWFGLWQAVKTSSNAKPSKGLEVLARYDGADIAKWSGEGGFKPIHPAGEKEGGAKAE